MIAATTLGLFLLAVLALLASPGPNMAFILAQGAAHGPRGAFAGAIGIALADLVLALAAASGVAALMAAWPPAFDLLRWAGAAYLVWLGVQALRAGSGAAAAHRAGPWRGLHIARMGFFHTLMNPKALLFFVVFLPQFAHPDRGAGRRADGAARRRHGGRLAGLQHLAGQRSRPGGAAHGRRRRQCALAPAASGQRDVRSGAAVAGDGAPCRGLIALPRRTSKLQTP